MNYFTRLNAVYKKTNINCVAPYKISLCLLMLALTFVLSSCASPVGKYNPDPKIITEPEPVEVDSEGEEITNDKQPIKINIINPVKISSSPSSSVDQPLDFRGIIVNYDKFSQAMVDAMKLEFERNNVIVNDSAKKELLVKVTEIEMYTAAFTYKANISAEVKYGNGAVENFDATRGSYASPLMIGHFPTKPLDAAFKDIVAKIIHNKNIQDYINQ